MPVHRRTFLQLAAAGTSSALLTTGQASTRQPIKAVAFDGLTIIDPRPVFALTEALFPGNGSELNNAWRTRQFEYTWLRSMGNRYADFWQITEQALVFACKSLKLELSNQNRDRLMQRYLELKAWPDVRAALVSLKDAGVRSVILANLTVPMLDAVVRNSGLENFFEPHLSTDLVKAFKPDPRAYQMGLDGLQLKREEIVFSASASWDAAGAKWFGYTTFWINRMGLPVEELSVMPDGIGTGQADLVNFVKSKLA